VYQIDPTIPPARPSDLHEKRETAGGLGEETALEVDHRKVLKTQKNQWSSEKSPFLSEGALQQHRVLLPEHSTPNG